MRARTSRSSLAVMECTRPVHHGRQHTHAPESCSPPTRIHPPVHASPDPGALPLPESSSPHPGRPALLLHACEESCSFAWILSYTLRTPAQQDTKTYSATSPPKATATLTPRGSDSNSPRRPSPA